MNLNPSCVASINKDELEMAKVVWMSGIEYVSGALCKCGKKGQHTHDKMLLATHRRAATTNPIVTVCMCVLRSRAAPLRVRMN